MFNNNLAMLGFLNLGGGEIFVIVVVILLFFGSKSIPQLAQGLGKGMRQFKDAMNGVESEIKREINRVTDDTLNPEPSKPTQEATHSAKSENKGN